MMLNKDDVEEQRWNGGMDLLFFFFFFYFFYLWFKTGRFTVTNREPPVHKTEPKPTVPVLVTVHAFWAP